MFVETVGKLREERKEVRGVGPESNSWLPIVKREKLSWLREMERGNDVSRG